MQLSFFNVEENLLPYGGEAFFYPNFFSIEDSDSFFKILHDEIMWVQEPIKIFGKEVMQPRLTAWYGDTGKNYSYSGITMVPHQWTESLTQIKEKIETVSGVKFTSALLNFYRDGHDSMGWHRDNEKELGPDPVIGSVSFGTARLFQFRDYYNKKSIRSIDLIHGSFLLMKGETQHYWEHSVPKTKAKMGPRINITFRRIIES